ncbi:MAG: hypothetical protein IJV22_07180 [Bacteroidales bacterium]|nr:hypothetical protein [Bacteroidales bacterium]
MENIDWKGPVMMAWTNGDEIHLHPSLADIADTHYYLHNYCAEPENTYRDLCYERYVDAHNSSEHYEAYSRSLWQMGRHIKAMKYMIMAAEVLFDADDETDWTDPDDVPWNHRFLIRFRWLVRECFDLCKQDDRLRPMLEASSAYRWYKELLYNHRH